MKLHVYKAADGWRWSLQARNGRIIADSGEAYSNRANCADGWRRVERAVGNHVEVVYD